MFGLRYEFSWFDNSWFDNSYLGYVWFDKHMTRHMTRQKLHALSWVASLTKPEKTQIPLKSFFNSQLCYCLLV